MGFLDFLTEPRISATPQDPLSVTPYEQPQAEPSHGLLSAVPERLGMGAPEQMIRPPQIEEKPSLLGGVGKQVFGKDDDGIGFWDRIYAAAGALGGADGGSYLNQKRKMAQGERDKEAVKADLAKKNAAFKAAYQDGKFDPQAYLEAIGDSGDAGEAFSLAARLAPKGGVDGGTAYTEDPFTGEIEWGERRDASHGEELAALRARELEGYRTDQIRLAEERVALARQREGRVARGRPSSGGAKLPAGFILD